MEKKTFAILTFVLLFAPVSASAFMFEGPFQVKNQFPLFLPINQPFLEQASMADSFSLSLSHSSVFLRKDSGQWNALLDVELTELNLRYRKRFTGLFELGVDVPVLRATGGFMDRPLEWYHRAFGFPDYGRSDRPRNEFLYSVKKDGMPVILGENDRAGFGDVRLTFKKNLYSDARGAAAVAADVELPTGNARIGYGSGSIDSALALLLDYDLVCDMRFYANAGIVFPGDLRAHQTVSLRTFMYAGGAVEYLYRPDIGLLAQLMVQTSPYPETRIAEIDSSGMLLVLGGRYYVSSGSFDLSLTEDPNTSGAPDFTMNLTYRNSY